MISEKELTTHLFMKTERNFFGPFAAVVVLLCATAMQSATLAASETSGAGTVTPADKDFMMAAAQSGMFEVRLGEIAKKKGATDEVKDFGAMMASDHGKAGEDLKAVAAKLQVTLPDRLDAEHKAIVDRLSKLSGADFDKAYTDEMVKAHSKDVSAFQQASKNAKDADVKAFAKRTLPVIMAHLKEVKTIMGGEKKKT
jgi:putative membrane protein